MPFELNPNVRVRRDKKGNVSQLSHIDSPYRGDDTNALEAAVPADRIRALADQYVRTVMKHLELNDELATGLTSTTTNTPTDDGEQLRFASEKQMAGNAVVSYVHTKFGVPVRNSGVSVRLTESPLQVVGAQSTLLRDLKVEKPSQDAPFLPHRLTPKALAPSLGLDANGNELPRITGTELFIYRYTAAARVLPDPEPESEPSQNVQCEVPKLPLPAVDASIKENGDYFVTQTHFTWGRSGHDPLHWTAFVEVQKGSVLYLRPHVGCLTEALAFHSDPVTQSGDLTHNANATEAALNGLRNRVNLLGLVPPLNGAAQQLIGQFVHITDVSSPAIVPPQEVAPNKFDYSSSTDNFSAVNAYYHCDRLFRMVEEMGLKVSAYFNGTTFPVVVDHRATIGGQSNTINAQAPGTANSRGSNGFRFALARTNSTLGLANDWRVVLHEFGHAILWDHVHTPNFGFAHSAGDSLAAILNDPGNQAERGLTFPWVAHIINRRHDRTPEAGWGWYGPRYDPFSGIDSAGYIAEQILSSTMFRIYRAAGGDSPDLAVRQLASQYVAFLIFKATSLLAPVTNANAPEDFADLLIQADTGNFVFNGVAHPAGVLTKVIRWGFECQGAFPDPAGPSPSLSRGQPPSFDVFIEDGRAGEYTYGMGLSQTAEMWVRRNQDGGQQHQQPLRNSTNSVYVTVRNRGTQTANNVRLRVFSSPAGFTHWPTGWTPLTAAPQTLAAPIPPGGSATIGPVSFAPTLTEETLLAIIDADGDLSNASRFSAAKPVPFARIVQCDNNMAFRTVFPV